MCCLCVLIVAARSIAISSSKDGIPGVVVDLVLVLVVLVLVLVVPVLLLAVFVDKDEDGRRRRRFGLFPIPH